MREISPTTRWILYDWANSAWVTVILTALFPVLYREIWAGDSATRGLSIAAICTQILVLLLAPVAGLIADRKKIASRLTVALAVLGGTLTVALGFTPKEESSAALMLYAGASVAYFVSLALYDGLLVHVSTKGDEDRVSLKGYGIGYLGGGLALLISVLVLNSNLLNYPYIIAGAGIWWILFSIPLFGVKQGKENLGGEIAAKPPTIRECLSLLVSDRKILLFLLGFWLYIDGINTIIRFAVDFGVSISIPRESVLTALLLTQFIGFPAAFIMVWISKKIGAIPTILLGLGAYGAFSFYAYFLNSSSEFYGLALGIGMVQGGVQALSRSVFAKIAPPDQMGLAFALYNLAGRFGCILGPTLLYLSSTYTGSSRLGVLGLSALFVSGGFLLVASQKNIQRTKA